VATMALMALDRKKLNLTRVISNEEKKIPGLNYRRPLAEPNLAVLQDPNDRHTPRTIFLFENLAPRGRVPSRS